MLTILIEHGGRRSQGEVDSKALGSDVERQDLRTISNSQSRPREASHPIKEEDHSNYSTSCTAVARLSIDCRARCQNGKRNQHSHSGNHEKHSASDFVNEKREEYCDKERPDLKSAVDE